MEEKDMKICANCGTQVADDASFCNNCGSSLVNNVVSEPAQNNASSSNDASKGVTPTPAPAPQPAPNMAPTPMQQGNQQSFGQAPYQQYVDPADHTAEFDPRDIADNKLFAVVPYLFGIIAGLIVGIYVKESPFVKFHIKNAIRIEIVSLLILLIAIIPFIGWVVAAVLEIAMVVLDIIAIVWAFQGKAKDIPVVSSIGFLK